MAKQQQSNKITKADDRILSLEHNSSYDDSLLPDSKELAKLKELDPDIIKWIKERTAKEQDVRHEINFRRLSLLKSDNSKNFFIDVYSLTLAFFIIFGGMALSAFLIYKDLNVAGTIFAGTTIITASAAFLNFRKKQDAKKVN